VPRADFVWWAEDTEYLHARTRGAGVKVRWERSARVLHQRVRWITAKPAWKYYYEARNTIYYRLRIQGPYRARWYRISRPLLKLLLHIALREHGKFDKFLGYSRGVRDGLTGRLGLRYQLEGSSGV